MAWASGAVVVIVDVSDGNSEREMHQVAVIHDNESTHAVTALDWRPGHHHQCLAIGTAQGRVTVWELTAGSPPLYRHLITDSNPRSLTSNQAVKSLAWAGCSSNVLLVLFDKALCAWEDDKRDQNHQSCWVWQKEFSNERFTSLCSDPSDRRHVVVYSPSTGAFASLKIMSSLTFASQSKVEYRQFLADIPAGSTLQCMPPGVEGLVFLILPAELILFDIELGVPLGSTPLPPSLKQSPFAGIAASCGHAASGISSYEPGGGLDFLVCYHVDGLLTVWEKRADFSNGPSYSFLYKTSKLFTPSKLQLVAVASPIPWIWTLSKTTCTYCSAIVVSGDGSAWKWRLPLSPLSATTSPMLCGSFHSLAGRATCFAAAPASSVSQQQKQTVLGVVGTTAGTLEFLVGGGGYDSRPLAMLGATLSTQNSVAVKGVAWMDAQRIVSYAISNTTTTTSQSQSQCHVSFFLTHVASRTSIPFRENAPGLVTGMKPSWSGEYLLLLCHGTPSELWGLPPGKRPQRLRAIDLNFSAVAWMPCTPEGSDTERLAFALADGRLGVVAVKGRKILDAKPILPSFAPSLVDGSHTFTTATAFSDRGLLAFGDGQGLLMLWDVSTGEASVVDPGCGPIAQLACLGKSKANANANANARWNDFLAIISSSGTVVVVADYNGGAQDNSNKGRKLQILLSTRSSPAFAVNPTPPCSFDLLGFGEGEVTLGVVTRDGGVAVLRNNHEAICLSSNPCLLPPACRRLLRLALTSEVVPLDSLQRVCIHGSALSNEYCKAILPSEDEEAKNAMNRALAWCAKVRGLDAPLAAWEMEASKELNNGDDTHCGNTAVETNRMLVAALVAGCAEEVEFWLQLAQSNPNSRPLWTPEHAVNACAERCQWHARLQIDPSSRSLALALQEKIVLEYCALGDVEAAVGYLLALPPSQDVAFYRNALMVLALASRSRSEQLQNSDDANADKNGNKNGNTCNTGGLFDQAAKILAGNAASIKDTMVSIPLLYCSKDSKGDAVDALQAGRHWSLAGAMLATAFVKDRSRALALERWAKHMAEDRGKFWWAVKMLIGWGETEAGVTMLADAGRPDAALAVLKYLCPTDDEEELSSLGEAIDRQASDIMREIQSMF